MKLAWFVSTLFFLGFILTTLVDGHGGLKLGFYKGKCGKHDAEKVIYSVVKEKIAHDPDVVSDLVRISFHDCFVRGCDASILLEGENTEQKARVNHGLGGLKLVNAIKDAIEKVCPGVVSCTDIIVLGARDAISLAGGKWYEVETGRRDGRVSIASEAHATLPPPTIPIHKAIELFAKKGLNKEDFVVLLGGHTVGTTHCHSFKERLHNFRNTNKPDPSIAPNLLHLLKKTCPINSPLDREAFLDQTQGSHFKIDNAYYKQILVHKGVLEIDQKLALNPITRGDVKRLAYNPYHFLNKFGPAMVKMSKIGVLTGNQGEIRKHCGYVN
ncbi:unnamed protein product [Amaranthus hypochondriacus]